jgi:hypothetical protein
METLLIGRNQFIMDQERTRLLGIHSTGQNTRHHDGALHDGDTCEAVKYIEKGNYGFSEPLLLAPRDKRRKK